MVGFMKLLHDILRWADKQYLFWDDQLHPDKYTPWYTNCIRYRLAEHEL